MTRSESLSTAKNSIRIAELFLLKYDAKLPEDFGALIVSDRPVLYFDLSYKPDDFREQALTLLGNVFGRSDWKAKLEYYGKAFDWSKTVDGVCITIEKAQLISQPEEFPVDPKQFPIQLEEQCQPS
jgi:hypothetical protein